ncbi:hypothetical protein PG999_003779 [Apiospora kogelbergensis]|uniref:Short chain dehydrogenase n=1 Tax=Apiospora kogelbergensis TaxID=1337665 RepID=A0AAW0R4N1_9PEZI
MGSGIVRETALAFATAGAKLVFLGRTLSTLEDTASLVSKTNGSLQVSAHDVDITDEAAVATTVARIGTWDILVHGAGFINTPVPVSQTDVGEYWKCYEVTLSIPSIFRMRKDADAAYLVSKLALAKTIEFLAKENLNVFFASIHPELKAMSESISGKLNIGLVGWPFTAQ